MKSAEAQPQGFTGGDNTEISEVEIMIRSSEGNSLLYIYFTVVGSLVLLAQKQLVPGVYMSCSHSCLFANADRKDLQQPYLRKVVAERSETGLPRARSG